MIMQTVRYSKSGGKAVCRLCEAGSYNHLLNGTTCFTCWNGSYCPIQTVNEGGIECPSHSSSEAGAASCRVCDPGYDISDGTTCTGESLCVCVCVIVNFQSSILYIEPNCHSFLSYRYCVYSLRGWEIQEYKR
jgi:hypothetical protein